MQLTKELLSGFKDFTLGKVIEKIEPKSPQPPAANSKPNESTGSVM
jgi:hypothetical protein